MYNGHERDYDSIYNLYESINTTSLLSEENVPDDPGDISKVNIYTISPHGSPEKSYTGLTVNKIQREGSYTILAKDRSTDKVIEVTKTDDDVYTVKVLSTSNNIEETFVGKEIGTFDENDGVLDIVNTNVVA
jgi:hypothetical protein